MIKYKPKDDKQRNVKLIMLTLLFTGCRYSDVARIKPEYYHDKDNESFYYARYITEKGRGKEVIVPILKPLMDAFIENGEAVSMIITQKS